MIDFKDIKLNQSGFTLIETIATLAIISILTFFAIERAAIDNKDIISVEAGLKSHIRYAQSKAMQSNTTIWGIRIDSAADEYWLFSCPVDQACSFNDNQTIPPGAQGRVLDVNGDKLRTSLANVSIGQISNGPGRMTLVFNDYGVPYVHDHSNITFTDPIEDSKTNFNPITDSITIRLADSHGNQASVSISPETGFVQ